MPYIDIVFHQVQKGGAGSTDGPDSRYDYTVAFPYQANVCQTPSAADRKLVPATKAGGGYASLEWGPDVTAGAGVAGGACGLFFCDSAPYPYIMGTQYHIGAWTATDQITTPAAAGPAPGQWNPAADRALLGYDGYNFVNGWIPVPGLTCPPGTVPPVPLPVFTEGNGPEWLPPLGWKIRNPKPPYSTWVSRPQWNGLAWTAVQSPGVPPAPAFPAVPDLTNMPRSFVPAGSGNGGCIFMEGLPDASNPVHDSLPDAEWLGKSNPASVLQCIGTGDANIYDGAAPPGSDRYAIYFQSINRTFYNETGTGGDPITGLFVHTQADADPGTQLVALCRDFPTSIVFGSLNYDLNRISGGKLLSLQSLQAAISATHQVLAIEQAGGNYYATAKTPGGAWDKCTDYALVPNAYVPHVELWAYQAGINAVLDANGSDHSRMMLRIRCNDLDPSLIMPEEPARPRKRKRPEDPSDLLDMLNNPPDEDPDEPQNPAKRRKLNNDGEENDMNE